MEFNVIDDTIPLVANVRSADTIWSLYIAGSIQVRETNAGAIEYRMGESTDWTFAGMKEVYA